MMKIAKWDERRKNTNQNQEAKSRNRESSKKLKEWLLQLEDFTTLKIRYLNCKEKDIFMGFATETLIEKNETFEEFRYTKEDDLEVRVKDNFKFIFGENSLFLPIKKKIESTYGIKGIPDAFLIDLELNRFFIVEIELHKHGVYEHIFTQIKRFENAFKKEQNKRIIAETIFESLKPEEKEKISSFIKDVEIFQFIHKIIFQRNFGILIVIDEETEDLRDLKDDIPNLECISFKTYRSKDREIYKVNWFIREKEVSKKRTLKEYSREDNLKRANPEVRETFELLEAEILKLPNVKQKIGDHYFDFRIEGSRKGTFANVNIRTDRLLIFIKMGKKHLKDPKKISFRVPTHWGYGDLSRRFSIDSKEDVNYAMTLIKQAYEYTKG